MLTRLAANLAICSLARPSSKWEANKLLKTKKLEGWQPCRGKIPEMLVRQAIDARDADAIWAILEPVIRAGETYPLPRNMDRERALAYWFSPGHEVFVAEDHSEIVGTRSEEHTSELQSRLHLVCRLLLEKKKITGSSRHSAVSNRRATTHRTFIRRSRILHHHHTAPAHLDVLLAQLGAIAVRHRRRPRVH